MGIQYVTVKVDTSGLYQPLSAAVGVVGVIGPAPAAGPGFTNPTLFTRALTGVSGEPYARVVPVLRVAATGTNAPVDPTGAVIANVGWKQPTDSKNNVIGPFTLVDTAATSFEPLSVDPATSTLRRSNGAAFQVGTANAVIVIDAFSVVARTVSGAATFWGAPLDSAGQPVPNLLMKPDAAPSAAFVDLGGNALTVDGVLASSAGGTGKPKAADGTIYHKMTFDICPLAKSINLALTNGALQVWAYQIDGWDSFDGTSPALADFANRQINIVCLSSDSNPDHITVLRGHVESSSPNDAGGGGIRPRIGVAMLPEGGIVGAGGKVSNKFSDWKSTGEATSPMSWASSRMVFVAHNSPDDAAAAVAGSIAGYDPWVSLVLKPVTGIRSVRDFSDQDLLGLLHPDQVGLVQPHVNPITHPDFLAGSGLVMGEGFTADGTGERLYIDIVRTIDDIAFRVKATLTSPQVIGTLRVNRPGLRILQSILRAMLNERVADGEIDDYAIDIPIQAIAEKAPKDRTADEEKQLEQVQNGRQLALNISITYAGAIHQLIVTLKFV
ncbi:MAG TPA: hypothetical protein VG406_13770 [Isosphaeraceae bacterium]|jgi:hypothetical protein|nr:hypothetical protein [Isosphaeraceae bacterium]